MIDKAILAVPPKTWSAYEDSIGSESHSGVVHTVSDSALYNNDILLTISGKHIPGKEMFDEMEKKGDIMKVTANNNSIHAPVRTRGSVTAAQVRAVQRTRQLELENDFRTQRTKLESDARSAREAQRLAIIRAKAAAFSHSLRMALKKLMHHTIMAIIDPSG